MGALKHRHYDAAVVAKHGGILTTVDAAEDDGIEKLFDRLLWSNGTLDGVLIDKHTFYGYFHESKKTELLKNTIVTEKSISKEKLTFGVLFKHREDYFYFAKYIEDNWLHFDACQDLYVNNLVKMVESQRRGGIFSTQSGVFSFFYYACVGLAAICCFGVAYEWKRLHRRNKRRDNVIEVQPVETR